MVVPDSLSVYIGEVLDTFKGSGVVARIVRDAKLEKREQRLRLLQQKKPYWLTINEGQHLGYYRGARVGKWVARYRVPGVEANEARRVDYVQSTLGEADDTADADGIGILSFKQAQSKAREWFDELGRNNGRKAVVYTVSDALDDYMAKFEGKSVRATRSRIDAIIRPALGHIDVAKLTAKQIIDWRDERAASPAKLRTSATAKSANIRAATGDDAIRRRRSTANRDLTVLKAALTVAYKNGKAASDDAWRKAKPFKKVDAAKMRYLSESEAKRLVNACDPVFRPMVQAALLTGCRYGELASVKVSDVDLAAGAVWLTDTKARKARVSYLEAEGLRLFTIATAGKPGDALAFPRPDGKRWAPSQQARYLANACLTGNVDKAGFHDLRRTFGARLAMRGVPMAVIAEALGDADERIVRKHYAQLSPSYLAETIRANVGGQGLVPASNVEVLISAR